MIAPIDPVAFDTQAGAFAVKWQAPRAAVLFGAICGAPNVVPINVLVRGQRQPFAHLVLIDGTWTVNLVKPAILDRADLVVIELQATGPARDALDMLALVDPAAATQTRQAMHS